MVSYDCIDIRSLTIPRIKAILSEWNEIKPQVMKDLERDPRAGVRRLGLSFRKRIERQTAERERLKNMRRLEQRLWDRGVELIAGVDEAGRGPLAGPVVAAAVILPEDTIIAELDDSKKLTPPKRDELFDTIKEVALYTGVGSVDNEEIDSTSILQAALKAMRIAVMNLGVKPDHILVDGNIHPKTGFPETPVVEGDALSMSIAAASVIAKVTRDRAMLEYEGKFPEYGFAQHKGYGTARHIDALRQYGSCKIHRRSFQVVRDLENPECRDFVIFKEKIKRARSVSELEDIGTSIGKVKRKLTKDQLSELRGVYRKYQDFFKKTGTQGEMIAAEFLEKEGYSIAQRNYRSAEGEIDIIAKKGDILAFVEVKADKTGAFGAPELRVDNRKQRRIAKTAAIYLQNNNVPDADFRFDVIAVDLKGRKERIEHIENAFWVEED